MHTCANQSAEGFRYRSAPKYGIKVPVLLIDTADTALSALVVFSTFVHISAFSIITVLLFFVPSVSHFSTMSRRQSAKSAEWRRKQEKDPHVRAARASGFRSRAAFKLMEMDDNVKLFFAGARIVDLGSAPGGWSQVAAARCGKTGKVAAVDLLPMAPIAGVQFVRGDFLEDETARALSDILAGPADIVLSDMAPNLSGVAESDQARAANLAEAALEFALRHLSPDGKLLVKVFQGRAFEQVKSAFAGQFAHSRILRPQATRKASREMYILANRPQKVV